MTGASGSQDNQRRAQAPLPDDLAVRLYGVKVEGLGEIDTFFERLE